MGLFDYDESQANDSWPVPGTVHLVDLEGTMAAKHAKGTRKDVILVPTPSSDPDDPVRPKFYHARSIYSLNAAQLVASSQKLVHRLHVRLHSDGWHCLCGHLLHLGTHCRRHQPHVGRLERWHRVHVPCIRMGLLVLATTGASVRQAAGLPSEHSCDHGNSSLGTIHQKQWPVDCQ